VADRAHLSIGEVLSLLREEFPDITISKIRFLESQGLLDPERTPSGYRKFYEEDVDRLRWILRQQREHFLPLKVIKGRLVDNPGGASPPEPAPPTIASATGSVAASPRRTSAPSASSVAGGGGASSPPPAGRLDGSIGPELTVPGGSRPPGAVASTTVAEAAPPRVVSAPPVATAPNGPAGGSRFGGGYADVGAGGSGAGGAGSGGGGGGSGARESRFVGSEPNGTVGASGGNYTIDELAVATGLSEAAIDELARFGLISGRDLGGTTYFDEEAATVAALAAGFARHGVEARHLRMYKNAAERESALFEQIVMPLVKQRNPQARQQAATALEELGRLSGELRRALLRQALGNAF
jgi:DNA-binding transcriptional MerR regulator